MRESYLRSVKIKKQFLDKIPNSRWRISPPGTQTGEPDIIGCIECLTVLIETKMPKGKKPPPHQLYVHEQWRKAGAIVIVARSVEELKRSLENRGFKLTS